MKMSVLVEEGVRRMRKYSRGMDFEAIRKVMENWSRKLGQSGFPATTRHQVVKEAIENERMYRVED